MAQILRSTSLREPSVEMPPQGLRKRTTIDKCLILLLAVPLVLMLGFGVYTRLQLSRIEERSRFVAETEVEGLAVLGHISRSLAKMRVNVRSHLPANSKIQQRGVCVLQCQIE
jgi:hypothetical protein